MPAVGWVVHSLNGIDLLYDDPATSTYFVEDTAEPPEQRIDEAFVAIGSGSSGVRVQYYNELEAPHSIDVIGVGATVGEAEAALAALQTQCDMAINGYDVTYEYQLDSTSSLVSWRVLRGKLRPRWHTAEEHVVIFGLAGRAISLGKLDLILSKN